MKDYASAYASFDIERARAVFSRPYDSGLNAAVECCDRWCGGNRPALYWESQDGRREVYTFEQLREASCRFASFLAAQGIQPCDRVAGLLPRTPEILITILGVWRAGAVYQPLFTAFGPKAIEQRLQGSGAKLVVTDEHNRAKLDGIQIPSRIVVTHRPQGANAGDIDLSAELPRHNATFEPVIRTGDDPCVIMFTSGTTGPPKAVLVPLKALASFVGYLRDAVDLRTEDRYWNIADPAWAYGLFYAVAGPLFMGHATLFYDGPFTVESTLRVIKRHGITNLAGAPTAYRLIMAAGPDAVRDIKGQLRAVSSAGEPLNPEIIRWFREHLATTVHDHYGQTELGMVVCNFHALAHPVHLGAAGFPMPGFRVVVLGENDDELPPGKPGELSIDRTRSALHFFAGYEGKRTNSPGPRYYRSGDSVELNDDGSISFIGRADDVITSAGYRIGPFDVESALIEHPAVAEVAVVGKPDPERTEIVKAFVVLRPGNSPSPELATQLQQHVRRRLSAHAYPREVEFVDALPKTPSGKIQRFILRNRETARSRDAGSHSVE